MPTRWPSNLLAGVSLAVCLSTAAMSASSFVVRDAWPGQIVGPGWAAQSVRGRVVIARVRQVGTSWVADLDLSVDVRGAPQVMARRWHRTAGRGALFGIAMGVPAARPANGFGFATTTAAAYINGVSQAPAGFAVQIWAVPLWLPCTLFLLPPLAWWARRQRGRAGLRFGVCRECGYDLRATPHRCPECGTQGGTGSN